MATTVWDDRQKVADILAKYPAHPWPYVPCLYRATEAPDWGRDCKTIRIVESHSPESLPFVGYPGMWWGGPFTEESRIQHREKQDAWLEKLPVGPDDVVEVLRFFMGIWLPNGNGGEYVCLTPHYAGRKAAHADAAFLGGTVYAWIHSRSSWWTEITADRALTEPASPNAHGYLVLPSGLRTTLHEGGGYFGSSDYVYGTWLAAYGTRPATMARSDFALPFAHLLRKRIPDHD